MGLELNDVRAPYRDFRTDEVMKYSKQMPLLIADARNPITVAQVMERRLNSERADWKNNYIDTGDGVAFPTNQDKFKIVRSAQFLRGVTSDSNFSDGALILNCAYESVGGAEFSRKDLKSILGRDLTLDEVRKHPVWQKLAGNQDLLDEYTGRMFAEMGKKWKYTGAMGIYLSGAQKVETARALAVLGLGDRSRVGDGSGLGCDKCRLVGVVPEALAGMIIQPSLEQALAVVNRHSGDLDLRRK